MTPEATVGRCNLEVNHFEDFTSNHRMFAALASAAAVIAPPPAATVHVASAVKVPIHAYNSAPLLFPTTDIVAALQPDWLGAPSASSANPGGAGNAEGNCALWP